MLSENIRSVRISKGLSQEELAIKLNVVRQTVSKWERGLSVPDSEMILSISEVLETSVSVLLGETVKENDPEDLKAISEKLEVINLQLARQNASRRRALHWGFILMSALIVLIFILIVIGGSSYQDWDLSDPELAVAGTFMHAFEFVFVRIAPFALIGTLVGAILTRRRD